MAHILIALAFMLLAWSAAAEEPRPVCDPREAYEVCTLKVQRNNALDETVQIEAARHRLSEQIDALNAYWRDYLTGLDVQRKLVSVTTGDRGRGRKVQAR